MNVPASGTSNSERELQRLVELWQQEKLAVRRQTRELREALPFQQRVERGLALKNLRYENTEAGGGQHLNLWFQLEHPGALEGAQIHVGDPVVLWTSEQTLRQSGVVGRRGQTRISVVVDHDYAPFVERGGVHLDVEADETTFERGEAALARFLTDKKLAPLRELLFGEAEPVFGPRPDVALRDQRLNSSQKQAVSLALAAEQVALIHGPPGTGKTRTLVEVVRQHLGLGRSVLVTAASNTAVDHLTRQLVAQGVKPLRLGHPTRVAEDLRPRTPRPRCKPPRSTSWRASGRTRRELSAKSFTRTRRDRVRAARVEIG